MRHLFIALTQLIALASCELFKDEPIPPPRQAPPANESVREPDVPDSTKPAEVQSRTRESSEERVSTAVLMEGQKLVPGRNWITSEARPGDVLVIRIDEAFPKPPYREEIRPYDHFHRPAHFDCTGGCSDIASYPHCFVRTRVRVTRDGKKMDMPKIGIEMGGNTYPLGEPIRHGDTTMTIEFGITEEMTDPGLDYTSAYLVTERPRYDEDDWTGPVGFVNPDECPGIEERENILPKRKHYAGLRPRYSATAVLKTAKEL